MQTSLYGFDINYVSRNGHFMVFSSADGLERGKLSEFQVKMLLSNTIPRLLELQVEELDRNIKLFYNITGKRKLSYMLRTGSITIKQMFELLYGIAEVLSASGNYMLQENRYILLEEYIYCGEHLTDLYLTYMPRETMADKNTVAVDLQQLLSRLVHKVSELQGSGYQELTSYFMEDSFNLPTLKGLLRKHISQLGQGSLINSPAKPMDDAQGPAFPFEGPASRNSLSFSSMTSKESAESVEQSFPKLLKGGGKPGIHRAEAPDKKAGGLAPEPPSFFNTFSLQDPDGSGEDNAEPLEGSAVGARSKLKLPAILVGVASVCLIWRMYLEHPSEAWLMICSGLTLLLGDLLYILWFIWKPWSKAAGSSGPSVPAVDLSAYLPKQRAAGFGDTPAANIDELPIQEEPIHARLHSRLESMNLNFEPTSASSGKPDESSYYEQLDHRTVLLGQREATVLLNTAAQHQPSAPYLEYKSQEGIRKVEMTKAALVIGRSGDAADFEHKEVGVSRLHTEIVREAGGFLVKDLGSRNGTYLNGQLLVPYQPYSLQEGDIVKLAATEFTFKMGS